MRTNPLAVSRDCTDPTATPPAVPVPNREIERLIDDPARMAPRREQTRRLMRKAGVQRGKPVFTAITDPAVSRPADLVNRQFKAPAPNRLWVTFVRTWQGFCYITFFTDACTKRIVGLAVSTTMRTEELPLQTFHAVWQSDSKLS
ncbi:hypothetical protein H7H80_14045 [Mycobacterium interjectum]|nr:hypothetical protein [Mycobacterium interjectum]